MDKDKTGIPVFEIRESRDSDHSEMTEESPDLYCVAVGLFHSIGSRGMEINEWLHRNTKGANAYAILDDENDFLLYQASHVVLTNPYDGLTKEVADKVIGILNVPSFRTH